MPLFDFFTLTSDGSLASIALNAPADQENMTRAVIDGTIWQVARSFGSAILCGMPDITGGPESVTGSIDLFLVDAQNKPIGYKDDGMNEDNSSNSKAFRYAVPSKSSRVVLQSLASKLADHDTCFKGWRSWTSISQYRFTFAGSPNDVIHGISLLRWFAETMPVSDGIVVSVGRLGLPDITESRLAFDIPYSAFGSKDAVQNIVTGGHDAMCTKYPYLTDDDRDEIAFNAESMYDQRMLAAENPFKALVDIMRGMVVPRLENVEEGVEESKE